MNSIFIFLATIVLLATPWTQAHAENPRIASMNMCADQYLIPLADKDEIVALSAYARNPTMSFYAREAQDYPVSRDAAEEILALRPTLVIASPFRRQMALAQLIARGVPILEVKPADSYQEIVAQTRQIATAIGHPDRGEALIAAMDQKLAAIPHATSSLGEAVYYQRRGFLTGTGTLVDDIMRRAGFTNLASRLGRKSVTRLPLELIIQARPDYMIVETESDPMADNGSALLFHPALARILPPERRLSLPEAMTICGGPFFPDAVALLAAQVRH